MNNDLNIPVISMKYEVFMKKCIGKSPENRHLWSSDNMALLLSQSGNYFNDSCQFEKVQDNLLYAVDEILKVLGINKNSQLIVLKDKLNQAHNINNLLECLDFGLNLINNKKS